MKRLYSLMIPAMLVVLALLMASGATFAEQADAPERFQSGDYAYVPLDDGTAEIVGYMGKDERLIVPATVDGREVTRIGDKAFEGYKIALTITLPEGVTSIGNRAFSYCSRLSGIVLPAGLESIGDYSFEHCEGLAGIALPDSLTEIGVAPFIMSGLRRLDVADSHPVFAVRDGALYNDTELSLVFYINDDDRTKFSVPEGTRKISAYAFYNSTLMSIILPQSVTSIGKSAFEQCESLINTALPSGITSIEDDAYSHCNNLRNVTFSDGLISIGKSAFFGCPDIKEIVLPDSVVSIGAYAFSGCANLTGVTLSGALEYIGEAAFEDCESLTTIVLPDGLLMIGGAAFRNCRSLTRLAIPDSVTAIHPNAFYNSGIQRLVISAEHPMYVVIDDALYNKREKQLVWYRKTASRTVLTVPHGVRSIGDYAFQYCDKLLIVSLPDTLTSVGNYAFMHCKNLTKVLMSEGLLSIGNAAFYGCDSLTSLVLPESLASIGRDPFDACQKIMLTVVPNSCGETYAMENDIPYTYSDELLYGWLDD